MAITVQQKRYFSNSSWIISIIHMGRPWLGYWVLPIPNQFGSLWVNFIPHFGMYLQLRIFQYHLVFFGGLVLLLYNVRDRAVTPFTKKIYSIVSFGWSGRAKTGNVLKKFL
jgi:molybdopterin-containing oxidoreductase family membrane subunit